MIKNRLAQHVIVFFALCLLGVVLTFFGLRLYYNETRLEKQLTREYRADSLQTLAGQATKKNGVLVVNDMKPDGFSFVNIGMLHIDRRFYDRLVIDFGEQRPQQDLLLAVRHQSVQQPIEKIIPRVTKASVEIELDGWLPDDVVIGDVGLLTNQLRAPYQIARLVLKPKRNMTNTAFVLLLWDCFAINKQWENWSINTHKSPYPVFIPPKILVGILYTVVGVLFALYLRMVRVPLINAWWATAVAAWMTLDAHYLVEKTVITKNTYDTFAHLTDDEKDLVMSSEPARLAQMIKSVLPDDGSKHSIRIHFGWHEHKLSNSDSGKRYLNGKLQYYLLPNTVYTLGKKMPEKIWKQSDFYFVDVSEAGSYIEYNAEMRKLVVKLKTNIEVRAEKLLDSNGIRVYLVAQQQGNQVMEE